MENEDLKVPGVAWQRALEALKKGDLTEAERLCEYMQFSDAILMMKRIQQRHREATDAKGNKDA